MTSANVRQEAYARSYALTLTALVTGVILAVAQGYETLVGWDVGEHALAATKRRTLRSVAWSAGASAVLAALLWLGAGPILAIFNASASVVEQATAMLAVSILVLPLSAASAVLYGALRSTGGVLVPMVFSLAASALVLLPLSWLLVERLGLGLAGLAWALAACEGVKAGLLLWRWLEGRWARIPSVAEAVPGAAPAAA